MPKPQTRPAQGDELFTTVSDEQFDDLMDLTGQQVVHTVLWADSMAALLDESASEGDAPFDLDVYLKDGVYFELYGVQCYDSLDSEPYTGYDRLQAHLAHLIAEGLWLDDLGVDEEDGLVLILCRQRRPLLYIPAGAWFLDEWDELPTDMDSDLEIDDETGA
jgi:hypothetical protein